MKASLSSSQGKVLPFIDGGKSKVAKMPKTDQILDQGQIGPLAYQINALGVIHMEHEGLHFKKDISMFEDELNKLELHKLKDGEELVVKGSGDNDDLVFLKKQGDIEVLLRVKPFETIEKLKKILGHYSKKTKTK